MAQEHFERDRHIGVFRIAHLEIKVFVHISLQVEFAFFHQLHDGCGGKRLRDAGDAENGVGCHFLAAFTVLQAETVGVDNLVVLHHHHI